MQVEVVMQEEVTLCRANTYQDAWHAITRSTIWYTASWFVPTFQRSKNLKGCRGLTINDLMATRSFHIWQAGRHLTCQLVNTVAASYIPTTSSITGGATEIASERKIVKYVELSNTSCFCPIIFETFGPIKDLGLSFLDGLGRRIADCTGDSRETAHLLQRISVTIQRIIINGSIPFCFVAALLLHHVRDHARSAVKNFTFYNNL